MGTCGQTHMEQIVPASAFCLYVSLHVYFLFTPLLEETLNVSWLSK